MFEELPRDQQAGVEEIKGRRVGGEFREAEVRCTGKCCRALQKWGAIKRILRRGMT